MKEEKKKSNIIVRILALLVTAALVLGALLAVVYRDRFNVDALKRWLSYRSLETSDTGEAAPFTHAGGDKVSIACLDSGVLQSSTTGAHYYSFSGEQYAEEVLAMTNPVLSASQKAGVIYDAGGQSLFLFQKGGEAFRLELDGNADLLSARVNNSGWAAVTAQQSGYKGAVTVHNDRGEKVIQIRLSSTFVVDAAISPDCKTVAVVTMDQKGGVFNSQLLLYPVNDTEPRAVFDLGSTMVLDLDYENDRIWVLGEHAISIIPTRGDEVLTYSFGRSYLKGCDFDGDGFALLLLGRYRTGSATEVVTVGADATAAASLTPSGQILSFDAAGDYCALLTGRSLELYSSTLTPSSTLDSTQGARFVSMAPNGSALLANDQKAWLYIPG